MKILFDIEAKEIAELRTLLLPDERLMDSKIADLKKQLADEIVNVISGVVSAAVAYPPKF